MSCPTIRPLLEMYLDGELDPARDGELERHLEACTSCAQARQQLQSLRQALRAEVPRFPAPARLRDKIQSAVRRSARPRFVVPPHAWPWVTAASLLLGAGGVFVGFYAGGSAKTFTADDSLAQEVVACHVRSLLAERLADVASSDRHTVKPWFTERLDYAPPVKDLEKQGYTLVGGRLDYVNRHKVAALVYQRRRHTINVFVWPEGDVAERVLPGPQTQRGYHLVPFRRGDMTGWAVSDLEATELEDFVRLFQEAKDR